MLSVFIPRAALHDLSACAPMRGRIETACALDAPKSRFRAQGSQCEVFNVLMTDQRTAATTSADIMCCAIARYVKHSH